MIGDVARLAVSNIFHRKLRSWLTMIGIFIGIAAVVALISLAQGLRTAINEQFASFGTNRITIEGKGGGYGPPGTYSVGNVTEGDLELVKGIAGVKVATGRLIRNIQVEFNNEIHYAYAVSIPEENDERALVLDVSNYYLDEGRMIKRSDTGEVVIGNHIASHGFGKEIHEGNSVVIKGKKYEVTGVLKKRGLPPYDQAVLMNEEEMRDLLDIEEEYDLLAAEASPGFDVELLSERVEKAMRNDRGQKIGEEDFTISTPTQLLGTANTIITIISIIVVGIASISLVVGGVGITNTMYTAVLERTKEIGIMKSIGARNRDIFVIFLVESGLLGVVGGIIGAAIGMGMAKAVELGATAAFGEGLIQSHFSFSLIFGALLFSFVVGAASGVTPAWQASRMKPVDALRHD